MVDGIYTGQSEDDMPHGQVGGHMEEMERPRGVKMIYAADGDPLSTSHRGKGLYG